ncbi:hypothetical protein P7K49_035394 [Saguinus oedipus]|uniref:Uncharacterized protein n=1 Tax=Saguinus oedipus TaxID=9490 RepID=A0ABQ9TMI5_SAGOE|nr:hypothetical protein P7K49_035394 [Saguinus oedipus]
MHRLLESARKAQLRGRTLREPPLFLHPPPTPALSLRAAPQGWGSLRRQECSYPKTPRPRPAWEGSEESTGASPAGPSPPAAIPPQAPSRAAAPSLRRRRRPEAGTGAEPRVRRNPDSRGILQPSRGRPGQQVGGLKVTAGRPGYGGLRSPFEPRSGAKTRARPHYPSRKPTLGLRQEPARGDASARGAGVLGTWC